MKSGEERIDIMAAYQLAGSYRGAAEICDTTHKTVKRIETEELARMSGHPLPSRKARVSNTEVVRDLAPATLVDDGSTVTWPVPGRQVVLWRDDVEDPAISARPARQVFVWAGGDGKLQAALDVIAVIRAQGIDVVVDPEDGDLIAADATRTAAAS